MIVVTDHPQNPVGSQSAVDRFTRSAEAEGEDV